VGEPRRSCRQHEIRTTYYGKSNSQNLRPQVPRGPGSLWGRLFEHIQYCLEYNFRFIFDVNLNVRKSEAFRSR